ncbi:uncharacterized protein LOC114253056 isoform X1 [Bombyx mandarina]|uniref:Uncharacterized protein LOC114253056 isoform X1 n=1 Tax=Bombyx mandarina TaxID=7092 RepID=A0A6J2KN80_BOMMA|nr:uncharacterized protein LOC114253056 isoform X1 [Bombyx mandarina]
MNITKASEESSCTGQENGDGSTDSERPLKKARFAWQVKGKYHLKNENSDSSEDSTVPGPSLSSESNSSDIETKQNLEILGDYFLNQDFNTIESVITDSEKSLLTPSTSVSNGKLQYPRYVSSNDNNENCRTSGGFNSAMSVPMSMVVSQNYTEDQCIARWQERQMTKGFVDNTVNSILESREYVSLLTAVRNSRFVALDVAELVNESPGQNIENEGILMAISAHGLQNQNTSSNINNSENASCSSNDRHSPSRESSPSLTVQENEESNELTWACEDPQKMSQFSLFPDSSISYQCFNDNQSSSNENQDPNLGDNHFEFLDAAIMFAIQSKGLTTLGSEYG